MNTKVSTKAIKSIEVRQTYKPTIQILVVDDMVLFRNQRTDTIRTVSLNQSGKLKNLIAGIFNFSVTSKQVEEIYSHIMQTSSVTSTYIISVNGIVTQRVKVTDTNPQVYLTTYVKTYLDNQRHRLVSMENNGDVLIQTAEVTTDNWQTVTPWEFRLLVI